MAFYNTNLHRAFFSQNLPVYPESKRRTVAEVEQERQFPSIVKQPVKGYNLYEERSVEKTHDDLLKNMSEKTLTTKIFFSQKNVETLHNLIRYFVYDQTGQIISRQTDDDLLIIMRAMYLQYSTNPISCKKEDIDRNIDRLNLFVLRQAVPGIISEIKQYKAYLVQSSQIPAPIPRAINVSNAGTRELRATTDIFISNPNDVKYGFTQ